MNERENVSEQKQFKSRVEKTKKKNEKGTTHLLLLDLLLDLDLRRCGRGSASSRSSSAAASHLDVLELLHPLGEELVDILPLKVGDERRKRVIVNGPPGGGDDGGDGLGGDGGVGQLQHEVGGDVLHF